MLIPKLGYFSTKIRNQRPITCLNRIYKWFTSCLLKSVDNHLDAYKLMQGAQRGAKEKCGGTTDNFMIDFMVWQDSQHGRRNLSKAWIDEQRAIDSADHQWLKEMFNLHSQALCDLDEPPIRLQLDSSDPSVWATGINVLCADASITIS